MAEDFAELNWNVLFFQGRTNVQIRPRGGTGVDSVCLARFEFIAALPLEDQMLWGA